MGQMANLGYVSVKVREYIKLRLSDPAELWPTQPDDFTDTFKNVFNKMKELTWCVFLGVAADGEGNSRLLEEESVAAIRSFIDAKSSLSIIHYFKTENKEEKEEEEKEKGNEEGTSEKLQSKDGEGRYDVCGLHRDSGILTCAVSSSVQGLEMFDFKLNGWVKIEELVKKLGRSSDKKEEEESIYLVMFIGEKIPLYSGHVTRYSATPHRVILNSNTERSSIVFLLDVAK